MAQIVHYKYVILHQIACLRNAKLALKASNIHYTYVMYNTQYTKPFKHLVSYWDVPVDIYSIADFPNHCP